MNRRGMTITEIVCAAVLTGIVLSSVVPGMYWIQRQNKAASQHLDAIAAVNNVLDEVTAAGFDKATPEALAAIEVPDWVARQLTEPKLIVTSTDSNGGKRITAELSWLATNSVAREEGQSARLGLRWRAGAMMRHHQPGLVQTKSRANIGLLQFPRTRRGTMMLQAMVMISLAMLIFAPMVAVMHKLLQANSQLRVNASEGLIQRRLETTFRYDCRQANEVSVQDNTCSLQLPDGRLVEYQAEGRIITRTWSQGDKSGVDHFRRSKAWQSSIEQHDGSVRLIIERDASKRTESTLGSKRQIILEATIGVHTSAANREEVKQ